MRREPSDPHDDLLLTERPVTIVTQATSAHDSMPTPYGSSEDEEALFSDVGSDDGYARNALAQELAADNVAGKVQGVVADPQATTPLMQVATSPTAELMKQGATPFVMIAIGLGLGWLFAKRR
jgi:lysozyme family protein